MSESEHSLSICNELARMGACMEHYNEHYRAFMDAAQASQWDRAGRHQEQASGYLEAGMDAFMRACRMQASEAENG